MHLPKNVNPHKSQQNLHKLGDRTKLLQQPACAISNMKVKTASSSGSNHVNAKAVSNMLCKKPHNPSGQIVINSLLAGNALTSSISSGSTNGVGTFTTGAFLRTTTTAFTTTTTTKSSAILT